MKKVLSLIAGMCLLFNTSQAEELNKQESIYFNFIDLNNDKLISFDEINQSLQLIFQLIDENLDGKISQEEIVELKNIIESLS